MGLSQVVAELQRDRDSLTESIVGRVWGVLPGYGPEHLGREELRRFVGGNVHLVASTLARGRAPEAEDLQQAVDLGTSRALQGIPLDSVIQAFRAAERTVLSRLLAKVPDLGPQEVRPAIDLLADTWDLLTQECITAYRHASHEIAIHQEHLERDLVGSLAIGDEQDSFDVPEQARLLGADPDQPHRAIALICPDGAAAEAMLRVRRHTVAELGDLVAGRILFGAIAEVGLLLVPSDFPLDELRVRLERALRRPELRDVAVAGIGEAAPRLRSAGRSCRQAMATARVLQRRGAARRVADYSDVLLDVALSQDADLRERLVATRIGALAAHPHLLRTVRTFLECDLSQTRTAEALFVHPNTVYYRLGRIAGLTGRDPRRLSDALELAMALRATDLDEDSKHGDGGSSRRG
jgi:sugar diacid utilization regulator